MKEKLTLKNLCKAACKIRLHNLGKTYDILCDSPQYAVLSAMYEKITKFGRVMPAFCVAIDERTRSYEGLAIEFFFAKGQVLYAMPFERLFARLNHNYYGINYERYVGERYEGRCFYLNLDKPINPINLWIEEVMKNDIPK